MQLLHSLRARAGALGPARADAVLAALFLLEAEAEVVFLVGDAPHAGLAALSMVPVAAALALRRRMPLEALVLAMIGLAAIQPLGRGVVDNMYSPTFAVLFLLFSTG